MKKILELIDRRLARMVPSDHEHIELSNLRDEVAAAGEAEKSGRCETCQHWKLSKDGYGHDDITAPYDPDTFQPMVMPFEVKECKHPKLLFCERPVETPGFAVADGSTYVAHFYTTEDFGCLMHEEAA